MVFEYTKNKDGHYVCNTCGETREKQNTMHYHLQKHNSKMPHVCTYCDKRFYQIYALEDHLKLRHSKKIICSFTDCRKSFNKKDQYRIHMARYHYKKEVDSLIEIQNESNNYKCISCKKDYVSYAAILYHVMDHISLSPVTV